MPSSVISSAKTRKWSLTPKALFRPKRYLNAWSRHHRSGGFGIHSPYAYRFVREVLRQPKPFYAYKGLDDLINTVRQGTTRAQRRQMDLIGKRDAKLLFRVTNFFNPLYILQAGAATGIESVAMLDVNHGSRLFLYDTELEQKALAVRVLQSQMGRVECYDDLQVALDEMLKVGKDQEMPMMALFNMPVDEIVLKRLLDMQCVLVLRNLHHNKEISDLFDACCDYMPMGQTYTNNKIAILNPNPKLQREDFLLWL